MHKETVKQDFINFLKNNKIIVIIASFAALMISAMAVSNHVLPISMSNEITYQDPNDSKSYMTFNPTEHSFYIQDGKGQAYSGTYSETSESYSLNNGFGQTIKKQDNGIVLPSGRIWIRK
jgi:hypothetical protein